MIYHTIYGRDFLEGLKIPRKISLMGLDQAGKTSILNILSRNYNLMDNQLPTAGIERHEIKILGIPIINWDFGGQESYREEYFNNLEVFEKTDSLFFVIDALNAVRYQEALEYYKEILLNLEKLELKPNIMVLIHKVDPNLTNTPEMLELIEEIKKLFLSNSGDNTISFFITSIFDRRSIIDAFSKNLQELISELKPFRKILETIALLLKLDAAILFDEDLMILSEFYKNNVIEEICLNIIYNSVYYINNANPKLAENFPAKFELVLNVKNRMKVFSFMEVTFRGWTLYLLTMGDDIIDHQDIIARFDSMSHIFDNREDL